MAGGEAATERRNVLLHPNLRSPLLAALALGPASFLTQFPATSVTVARPHIGRDLEAGVSGLQWVVVAYTLAFAVLLLSGGALADRLGPRRACLIGYGTFAAASLACAASCRAASSPRRSDAIPSANPCDRSSRSASSAASRSASARAAALSSSSLPAKSGSSNPSLRTLK